MYGDLENKGLIFLNIAQDDPTLNLFLEYLRKTLTIRNEKSGKNRSTDIFDLLHVFLGSRFLEFLDTFSDEVIKIPSSKELARTLEYIKIYKYVSSRGYTDLAYADAARLYKRKVHYVVKIVQKIKDRLECEPVNG
jgi:hypothetical protein